MGFQYIIAKVLKYIYQKWGCIFHFKLWVKSYGNKKKQKPIWQFDSKSLIPEKNVQVIFKLNMWYGVEKILSKGTTSCVNSSIANYMWKLWTYEVSRFITWQKLRIFGIAFKEFWDFLSLWCNLHCCRMHENNQDKGKCSSKSKHITWK